ncbi:hypothetical protein Taro_001374 [Colocasia esculenta]|uniref:Uncharacterized protein n=1 Tax=Colocasia esculenta TaxID=4460 RepID=A0A843THS8_COLES|nr:hypothetical protein [Colocasia esculenta]
MTSGVFPIASVPCPGGVPSVCVLLAVWWSRRAVVSLPSSGRARVGRRRRGDVCYSPSGSPWSVGGDRENRVLGVGRGSGSRVVTVVVSIVVPHGSRYPYPVWVVLCGGTLCTSLFRWCSGAVLRGGHAVHSGRAK